MLNEILLYALLGSHLFSALLRMMVRSTLVSSHAKPRVRPADSTAGISSDFHADVDDGFPIVHATDSRLAQRSRIVAVALHQAML